MSSLGKHWKIKDKSKMFGHKCHIQKHTEETKQKISESRRGKAYGENNGNWKGNQSEQEIKHRLRGRIEWKIWRNQIFARDNYSCQECGVHGGYLEPHHIVPLKVDIKKVFEVNNGITL